MIYRCFSRITLIALAIGTVAAMVVGIGSRQWFNRTGSEVNDLQATTSDMILVQQPSERRALRPELASPLRKSNQRSSFFTLRAFRDAIGESWKATVELFDGNLQVAYGTIVDADGFVVTKASQLGDNTNLICELYDGRQSNIQLLETNTDLDLALLRIEYAKLPVIDWAETLVPSKGKWLATTSPNPTPIAVGVVSAGFQSVEKKGSILGVKLTDSTFGPSITEVVVGSGAERAGLKVGDNIVAINGKKLSNKDAVTTELSRGLGGQSVVIEFTRGNRNMNVTAHLMDIAHEMMEPTELEVNGSISNRSSGYSRVFLHDTVLLPNQCGGPLVDLDGKAVGINIARAGRVTCYALPVDLIRPAIQEMLNGAKAKALPANAPSQKSKLRPVEVR